MLIKINKHKLVNIFVFQIQIGYKFLYTIIKNVILPDKSLPYQRNKLCVEKGNQPLEAERGNPRVAGSGRGKIARREGAALTKSVRNPMGKIQEKGGNTPSPCRSKQQKQHCLRVDRTKVPQADCCCYCWCWSAAAAAAHDERKRRQSRQKQKQHQGQLIRMLCIIRENAKQSGRKSSRMTNDVRR